MRWQLLDRVDSLEPGRAATGRKAVSFEEAALDRPGSPSGAPMGTLPGTLLLEAIAQLGSFLLLASTDFRRLPLVTAIERAALPSPLGVGEVARLAVRLRRLHEDAALLDGEAVAPGGRVLARVEGVQCVLAEVERWADSAELRAQLRALRGEYPSPR